MSEDSRQKWVQIPTYRTCFVCGEQNPIGLKLKFFSLPDGTVETEYIPKPEHCGYSGIVHGGIISAILDEGIGWTGFVPFGKYYLTMELRVRFRKPVRLGRKYKFRGELVKRVGSVYVARGALMDEKGTVYAEGEGKYFLTDELE